MPLAHRHKQGSPMLELSKFAANLNLSIDENGSLMKLKDANWKVVKSQKDTINAIVKRPQLLELPIDGKDCVGRRLCLDEDFCTVLVPKLLESMCLGGGGGGIEEGAVQSILRFLAISTKISIECRRRMAGWLIQFIPSIIAEHRPPLIQALPAILGSIEGVLEDALFKNVRDGRQCLAQSSLSCLLHFKSPKLAEFFEECTEESLSMFPLVSLIEATRVFPQCTTLKMRIRSILSEQLLTGNIDLTVASRIEFTCPTVCETVDLFLLLVACSKSDAIGLHRQFHRACLAAPELTAQLLQQIPINCESLSSALLEVFSVFLENSSSSSELTDGHKTDHHLLRSKSTSSLLFAFAKRFLNSNREKSFLSLLAGNIMNGSESSGISSLRLLQRVIQVSPSSRWSCLGVVKSLLDGLESMPPAKLSLFYSVYASLARDSDTVSNELLLLLKKQLYSFDPVYKRIGTRGVVTFCAVLGGSNGGSGRALLPDPDDADLMAEVEDEDEDESKDEFSIAGCSQMVTLNSEAKKNPPARIPLPAYTTRLLISLLEEAVKSLRSDDFAFSLLLEGLSELLSDPGNRLDSGIVEWIAEWVTAFFKDEFIREADSDETEDDNAVDTAGDGLAYDCDDGENVLFLDLTGKHSTVAALAFRLLAKSELILSAGSLDSIDALEGCPVRLLDPNEQVDGAVLLARRYSCLCLMREVVRCFSVAGTEEKSLKRLNWIVQLEASIASTLASKPAFLDELRLYGRIITTGTSIGTTFATTGATTGTTTTIGATDNDAYNGNNDITNGLILQCLAETRKLTPLRRKDDEDCRPLTLKSARESFRLPISLLQRALLKEDAIAAVAEFCLAEGRGQFDGVFLIELARRKGANAELLNQLAELDEPLNSLSETISSLARETWKDSETSSAAMKVAAFKLLRRHDPEFTETPVELIKAGHVTKDAIVELVRLLDASECFQLAKELFAFEADDGSGANCDVAVFKTLLNRTGQLLSTADLNTIAAPLGTFAHLLQYARIQSANHSWLMAVIKEVRPGLQGLLKPACPFFVHLEADGVLLQAAERSRALGLLRQLQQCTRSLQVICSHVKYAATLPQSSKRRPAKPATSAIPVLRRVLEALIIRVGEAVGRCGCSEAFWVGNLKHRDLDGAELSSQVALMSVDCEEDNDDEDSDGDGGNGNGNGNGNEVFNMPLSKEFISTESESYDEE